jgi:hypothetical protein
MTLSEWRSKLHPADLEIWRTGLLALAITDRLQGRSGCV